MRLAFTLLLVPSLAHAAPPKQLACLARHYAIEPVEQSGAWLGKLPDGTLVPWNDGKQKTLDEALEHPDLHDTLLRPYIAGRIRPVTDPNDDPGRVRVDALFVQTYPKRDITRVEFMGRRMQIHARVKNAFERVSARLSALRENDPALAPWLAKFSGTFVERNIAGTDRPSSHSYGVSIDLDAGKTDYWRWSAPADTPRPKGAMEGRSAPADTPRPKGAMEGRSKPASPLRWRNSVPQPIVDAFEAEGFIWGGRWYHYDTMHFEYRPELLDPDCRL
jgi:hypothetical protein